MGRFTGIPNLRAEIEWQNGEPYFVVNGTLNFEGAEVLRQAVASALPSIKDTLVIDCSKLYAVDSAGIGALVGLYRMARDVGKSIALRDLPPKVAELLRITKLDRLLSGISNSPPAGAVQATLAPLPEGRLLHCWEQLKCEKPDCCHYGRAGYLCWTTGEHCCVTKGMSPEDRILECFKCEVYKNNVNYLGDIQDHFERYVTEAEQAFARLRMERDTLGRELGKTRALLEAGMEQTAEYVFACDAMGRIVVWNAALTELTGRGAEEVTDISAAVRLLQPGGGPAAWNLMEFLEGRYPTELYETVVLNAAAEERIVSWGCIKVKDQAGQHLGLLATGRDITEYRRAEQALLEFQDRQRYVIENIAEGMALLLDERIAYANQALADLAGYPLELLEGLEFVQLFVPDRQENALRLLHRGTSDGAVLRYQSVLRHKSGSEVHVEITQGTSTFRERPAQIVMLRDVSARRRLLAYERLIPICSSCGAVRDDSDAARPSWHSLEEFMESTVERSLTHTLCPHCADNMRLEAQKLGPGSSNGQLQHQPDKAS